MDTPDAQVLADFSVERFEHDGEARSVYAMGQGPAVIVIHEIPGITPLVAAFGRKVAAAGLTAVLPDLFGTPGKAPTQGYIASSMAKACISKEFTVMAMNKTSPVISWLRALSREWHDRCGGPGVGAVGMCLTGGFALGMMVDPVVVAPVLSQPSLPFPVGARRKGSLGVSDVDLAAVRRRVADGTPVIGLRFTCDPAVPEQRFARLRQELGDGFIGVEIDSSEGNPWGYPKGAHSVLTEHYSDAEGSPTQQALTQVLDFFTERLGVTS